MCKIVNIHAGCPHLSSLVKISRCHTWRRHPNIHEPGRGIYPANQSPMVTCPVEVLNRERMSHPCGACQYEVDIRIDLHRHRRGYRDCDCGCGGEDWYDSDYEDDDYGCGCYDEGMDVMIGGRSGCMHRRGRYGLGWGGRERERVGVDVRMGGPGRRNNRVRLIQGR